MVSSQAAVAEVIVLATCWKNAIRSTKMKFFVSQLSESYDNESNSWGAHVCTNSKAH